VNATVASETPSKAAAAVSGAVGWAWWVVKALIGGLLIAWALAWAWQFPV
jgi:Na+-translocating ferredoxin:NAD+ oxidoreductase RnfD subunit